MIMRFNDELNVSIDGEKIESVKQFKHLGVTINDLEDE